MKKIKLIAFLTVVLGFAIFSCTNDRGDEMDGNVIKVKDIEFVGIEHNIMLNETYEFFKEEYSKKNYKNLTAKNKKDGLEKFLISRVNANKKYSERSNEIGIQNIKNIFKKKQTISKSTTYSKKVSSSLSDTENLYLETLNETLGNTNFENDIDFEEKISNLEIKIENDKNLSNEQLITLFSATQTARYSYIYWKENWDKWIDLSKSSHSIANKGTGEDESEDETDCCDNTQLQGDPDGGDDGHNGCLCEAGGGILQADVTGAIGGAVGAWVVNVIPGLGQAAYGSAIIGGAAGNSAIEAANQLFNW